MNIKSVLIIRCGALGDLVYATSVIDALLKQFGDSTKIDFVTTPGSGKIFEQDTRVHRIFPLKHKKIPVFLSRDKKNIINYSKKNPYDILINFEYGKQFRSLIKKIHAIKKIGAQIDPLPNFGIEKHMVEVVKSTYKSIINEEIFQNAYPKLVGSDKVSVFNKYTLPQKYIIISPSNSHQKRNILNYRAWQNHKWKSLIQKISKHTTVVIIGGKNEEIFFQDLQPYPSNAIDLVGNTTLSDLITIIENATALIATDTGTAHIASAVNTEVFALIGPTPASHTGPFKTPFNRVHIISKNLECAPCYKTSAMKECKDNICMKEISVDEVFNSVKSANVL